MDMWRIRQTSVCTLGQIGLHSCLLTLSRVAPLTVPINQVLIGLLFGLPVALNGRVFISMHVDTIPLYQLIWEGWFCSAATH